MTKARQEITAPAFPKHANLNVTTRMSNSMSEHQYGNPSIIYNKDEEVKLY